MYVWFDALNIYRSGVEEKGQDWWPADLHVIGKGILRFHAIYWPAFLLSAGLALPKTILVHEYLTIDGQKMSKSVGNIIDPVDIIKKYGADGLRYYFLAHISPFADGDFSEEKLKDAYNADLANGLGNLIARVAKLCENATFAQSLSKEKKSSHILDTGDYSEAISEYKFNDALAFVWEKIRKLDKFINDEKPWELQKNNSPAGGQKLRAVLAHAVDQINEIAALLEPFLPTTAEKIESQFTKPQIKSEASLFPRIS